MSYFSIQCLPTPCPMGFPVHHWVCSTSLLILFNPHSHDHPLPYPYIYIYISICHIAGECGESPLLQIITRWSVNHETQQTNKQTNKWVYVFALVMPIAASTSTPSATAPPTAATPPNTPRPIRPSAEMHTDSTKQ